MPPYRGLSGFLPGRASLMLDVIVVTMFGVLVLMGLSVYTAKFCKMYRRHKVIQIALSSSLLIVLLLFETDIHFLSEWTERADASPYFNASTRSGPVLYVLWIHLIFAISTFVIWTLVLARALARFPRPPGPGPHSAEHTRWGWIAAVDMVMTTVSGWLFYWMAFVA